MFDFIEKYHRRLFIGVVIVYALFIYAIVSSQAAEASDTHYTGFHITVPLTFDAVGAQVVFRGGHGELRAGVDTRGVYQVGAGITGGASNELVGSAGAAWSSHQHHVLPYLGARYGEDWEGGFVSYGLDDDTTYLFAGRKASWDDEDSNGGGSGGKTRDSGDGGDGDGGNGGTDDGGDDGGDGGDDGGDGGGDTYYANNRSGLGDGTNPGQGGGRENSSNAGSENPHNYH